MRRGALRKLQFNLLEKRKNQLATSLLHMETLLIESLLLLESVYCTSRNPITSDHQQLASSVCEYIRNHYVKNATLASLVKVFYGNEYMLPHNFNLITRLSILQCTNLVRLSNAKEMLSSPEKCSLLIAISNNVECLGISPPMMLVQSLDTCILYHKFKCYRLLESDGSIHLLCDDPRSLMRNMYASTLVILREYEFPQNKEVVLK